MLIIVTYAVIHGIWYGFPRRLDVEPTLNLDRVKLPTVTIVSRTRILDRFGGDPRILLQITECGRWWKQRRVKRRRRGQHYTIDPCSTIGCQ